MSPPKSPQRMQFESLTQAGQWGPAVNMLSSLAMFEMLPALKVFDAATRSCVGFVNWCLPKVVGGRVVHASQSSDGVIVESCSANDWDKPVRYPL